MPGDWGTEWKAAKNQFEAKTGQKKPSEKSIVGIRKGSGLEDALKACDGAWTAIEVANSTAAKLAAIKKFEADIKVFDTKMATYEKVLAAAIVGADAKLLKPELDILEKQLAAISHTMKAQLKAATVAAEGAKTLDFTAKTLMTSVTGAVARAKLFAAKVTSRKDPKIFNDGVVKATRDITQNIGNVEKLRQKGYKFPDGDPTNLFKVLTPWAQGDRMLKPTADQALVKREIGAYLQAIAGVEKWAKG
jgi:hypothetical protein